MLAIRTILIAAVAASPIAAAAAELPVTKLHSAHVIHVHRMSHGRVHVGYYFGQAGARWGGTSSYWYSSAFAFGGAPGWAGGVPGAVAGPRRAAAIACYVRPPIVCLEEPVVRPVALAGPPR
jgi:hypothetical protein